MNQSERILQLEAEVKLYRSEIEFILQQAEQRRDAINAPEDPMIKDLCERIGYGAVMDSAARQWQRKDNIGAHTTAHCVGVLRHILSTPTPSTSGMLALAKAAREKAENDEYHCMYCSAIDRANAALSPEEIKLLEE